MSREIPHLLLVEEDALLADITSFRLELLGYHVSTLGRGADVFSALTNDPPDVLILDTQLPDMDGLDLLHGISSDPKTADIPVLIFSVLSDLDSVQRAHDAGASDYLVAPYEPSVLEQKIEKLLRTSTVVTN